jgi:hypothetical protein
MNIRRIAIVISFGWFCTGSASPSLLVSSSDSVFKESQARLTRTTKWVDEARAPTSERTLFLQAENFYRYRFEPPTRGGRSFLAEAAAAATDFPAFQALAGTFDLFDLRIRMSDAAVQLWEMFLIQFPSSSLRPLTLYRLGWAYHSIGVSGFPREEPSEAFDELIRTEPQSFLGGLALQAKSTEWKSKSSAATRSLLPGLGQIYVGETRSGVLRMAVAAMAAAAFAVPTYLAFHRHGDVSFPLVVLGLGGLIVLSYDYTSSYEDSQRGVVQWNERAESMFNLSHPQAP